MLESQPRRIPGVRAGFALLALILLLDALLLVLVLQLPITFFSFVCGLLLLLSLPALLIVAYFTTALRNAQYDVVAGALIIQWGRLRQIVPLKEIAAIVPGEESGGIAHFRGLRWPGLQIGRGTVVLEGETRPARFFATRGLTEQLFIVTGRRVYAISPADRDIFRDSLVALLRSTLPKTPPVATTNLDLWQWPLWRDNRAGLLLAVAVGLNLLLFALLSSVYGGLPESLPLAPSMGGEATRIASRSGLFIVPFAGFAAWLCNGLLGLLFYRRPENRPVATIIWGATVAIEIAAWIAIINLI